MAFSIRMFVVLLAVLGLGAVCPAQTSPDNKADLRSQDLPFEFLKQLSNNYFGSKDIRSNLTEEQQEEFKRIWQSGNANENLLGQVQSALSISPLRSRRLNDAIQLVARRSENEIKKSWMAQLSAEQIAELRRRNRHAIAQAIFNASQKHTQYVMTTMTTTLEQAITNQDLLSILEIPRMQDLLELTDSQYEIVMNQVELARNDAENTILDAMTVISSPLPSDTQDPSETVVVKNPINVIVETRKILSAEQWTGYEKMFQDMELKARLTEKAGLEKSMAINMRHGSTSARTSSQNGKTTVVCSIHNAFTIDAIAEHFKVTSEQRDKIAKIVEQATTETNLQMTRSQEIQNRNQLRRAEQLEGLLREHIARVNAPLNNLLTPEQLSRLHREQFQGKGLKALQSPAMVKELQLTESQIHEIEELLKQPAPSPPNFNPLEHGVEFGIQSPKFQKLKAEYGVKYQEYKKRIDGELQKLLTEPQLQRFTQLSGYQLTNAGAGTP